MDARMLDKIGLFCDIVLLRCLYYGWFKVKMFLVSVALSDDFVTCVRL